MISGNSTRRDRALAWSTLISAVLHVLVLTLAFYAAARVFVQRGEREIVTHTSTISIEHEVRATPKPVAVRRATRRVRSEEALPARVPLPELSKEVPAPATPLPLERRISAPSKIERDEAGFAKEVARLNAQDGAHAIPTIAPGERESSSKQYAFNVPANLSGDEHGNGIITPTQNWHDNGRDCYYGRYAFTYPDGAQEYGDIVWPFCYEPALDPFKLPPHPIPFPLPLPGYRLPPNAQLPPIEKSVYEQWVASGDSAP